MSSVITVPKDTQAETALDTDSAARCDLIEYHLRADELALLRARGVIDAINESGDCNIDEYEDESVKTPQQLTRVLERLSEQSGRQDDLAPLIRVLAFMTREAIQRGTGLYFYL